MDFEIGINARHYLTLISFTILVYEYFITFSAEVDRMWYPTFYGHRMGWNWVSFFFYLNRYLVLFSHGPVILEYFWTTGQPDKLQICHALLIYHQYLVIVIQAIISCMLMMRVYALYGRSRRVLAVLVGVVLAAVACGCWSILSANDQAQETDLVISVGCAVALSRNQSIRSGVAWGGMLAFDTIVFVMTFLKALSLRSKGQDLITVLLRDGAIYFGVIMVANLANILMHALGGPFTRGLGSMPVNIISSVMISRLVLNLRDPKLVRTKRSGEPGIDSTAGFCPNISTFVHPQYPEDGWVPTYISNTTYNELDEVSNGYQGYGQPPTRIQTHGAIQLTPADYRL